MADYNDKLTTKYRSTELIDELQKLSGQAAGILTVIIEDPSIDESIQQALGAVRDLVLRMDILQSKLHKDKSIHTQ